MGAHVEIVVPRYVVLTRLADSWIPRASLADLENAEAEAFRWRRIYGPSRTRVAELWVSEPSPPSPPLTPSRPAQFHPAPQQRCACPSWREAAIRAFALYLSFVLANRILELLILLAN